MEVQGAGSLYLVTPTATILSGSSTSILGAWVHMAVVRNSNTITLYQAGIVAASGAIAASTSCSPSAAAPFYIGGDTTYR